MLDLSGLIQYEFCISFSNIRLSDFLKSEEWFRWSFVAAWLKNYLKLFLTISFQFTNYSLVM